MRQNPSFALDDPGEIRRIVREHPWATLVSATSTGLQVSHYPVVLEGDDLTIVSHVGRPDDAIHELGEHDVVVILQGPHGYVSPGWYDADPAVPTWNFVTVHLHGRPELLSAEENLRVLADLVDVFEAPLPEPRSMNGTTLNADYAARISRGTVGFRLRPTRVEAKAKLSQNKPEHIVRTVVAELEGSGPYAQAELAAAMRRVHPFLKTERADAGGAAS